MIPQTKSTFINRTKSLPVREPTDEEFDSFRELVLKELGLNWTGDKKYLLYTRLQRRLQFFNFTKFRDYLGYLKNHKNHILRLEFSL